jgi:hypothetical protein
MLLVGAVCGRFVNPSGRQAAAHAWANARLLLYRLEDLESGRRPILRSGLSNKGKNPFDSCSGEDISCTRSYSR